MGGKGGGQRLSRDERKNDGQPLRGIENARMGIVIAHMLIIFIQIRISMYTV